MAELRDINHEHRDEEDLWLEELIAYNRYVF